MKFRKDLFFVVWFCFPLLTVAQFTITSTTPGIDELGICNDSAAFTFNISSHIPSVTGVVLDIHFPPGMTYVGSSLSNTGIATRNVSFQSVTNNVLRLSGANMGSGDVYDFRLEATANCEALDYFLSAGTFQDTLYLQYNGSQLVTDSTADFNNAIAYPELSMPQPATPSATLGQSVTRNVLVNNSGNGCLQSFDWYDAYEADIRVDSVYCNGVKLNTTTNGDTIFYSFSSTEFVQMGDSNAVFCLGDGALTLTEYLTLTGCTDKGSDLRVSWGCDGTDCNSYTTTGDVSYATVQPNLQFTFRDAGLPACFHEQANRKEMIITNAGQGIAASIEIEIKKFYYAGQFAQYKYDGIDPASVEMKVNNGSFSPVTPKYSEANLYYNSCSQPFAYRFRLDVPDLSPGDSVVIAFEMINCEPTECGEGDIRQGAWGYNYRYTLPCVGSTTIIDNRFAATGGVMTFSSNNYDNPTISQGQAVTLTSMVQTASITYPGTGQYIVRFELPDCGMTFSGNAADLSWTNIAGVLNWPQNAFSYVGDTVEASFNVSDRPANFDMAGSEINLLVTGDCNCASGDTLKQLSKVLRYVPEISCTTPAEIELYCEDVTFAVDPCTAVPCDGLQMGDFSFQRSTYGQADNDGNRRPDGPIPDFNLIRLDRARLGDTLTASLMGYMNGSSSFSYGYADMIVDIAQYVSPVSADLILYDADGGGGSGAYLTCANVPFSQTDSLFRVDFSIAQLSGSCPAFLGLQFSPGDSVWITARLQVDTTSNHDLDVGYVNPVELYVSSVANPSLAQRADCGSAAYSGKFQIVPMVDASFVNQVASNTCGQTQGRTYLNLFTAGDYLDMFPYEYRTWSFPDSLVVTPPADFDFVNAYLFLRFFPYTYSLYPSPVYSSADSLVFDLRALVNNGTLVAPDDGYELQFFTTWEPNCYSVHNTDIPVPLEAKFSWEAGLENYDLPKSFAPTIRHNAPALSLSNVSNSTQDGLSSTVNWTVSLSNSSNSSSSPYTFLAFSSPSGAITVTDVSLSGGSSRSQTNGIYELGTLGTSSTSNYVISANYASCSLDTLYVIAGWNCGAYPTDLSGFTCALDTFLLTVDPKPAAAQLNVNIVPASPVLICSPLSYEIAVSSTQMANVQDLVIDIYHTGGGLDWVTGSANLEYPDNSGFASIADPSPISGGVRFTMADFNGTLASEGLEGLGGSNANNRTLNLQFQVQLNCDFLSGDVFYVRLTGTRPCGDPITLVRIMDPLTISGVLAPYNTVITSSVQPITGCGDNETFRVKVVPDGTTGSTEQVWLTVPDGINYVSGSYVGIQNAPGSGTMTTTSLPSGAIRFSWDLPNAVSAGDSIVFSVELDASANTGCSNNQYLISMQTTFQANVVCGGSNCPDYFGSSGSGSTYLTLAKPDLELNALSSTVWNAGSNYDMMVFLGMVNNGEDLNNATTTIEFYLDRDSSLHASTGDYYLGALSQSLSLAGGGNTNLTVNFSEPKDSIDLNMPILAVIRQQPANTAGPDQCLCENLVQMPTTDVVLPLQWIDLSGAVSTTGNELEWLSNAEEGIFSLERKAGTDRLWEAVHQEPTRSGATVQTYRFADDFTGPIAWYRVQLLGQDGSSTASRQIRLLRSQLPPITGYPNPTRDWLYLTVPHPVAYLLTDIRGQVLKQGAWEAGQQELDLSELSSGVYLLEFYTDKFHQVMKVSVE